MAEQNQSKNLSPAWTCLSVPYFRPLLLSHIFFTLGGRALAVVIGFQVYDFSQKAIALGLLGLIEAVPAIALFLYGGYISDRYDRRRILLYTTAVSVVCGGLLTYFSTDLNHFGLTALYAVIFLAGMARGFADPARSAFEAQIIPRHLMLHASAWVAGSWQACAVLGPALGGLSYGYFGPVWTYLLITSCFGLAFLALLAIPPHPLTEMSQEKSVLKSMVEGVRYVFKDQVLFSSMALDLFAVLFGGAVALFPIYARDILKVGPEGLGLLAAAPSVGSMIAMAWAMIRPPKENAGKTLLWSVAGFGVCIMIFGLSKSFALSIISLIFSGAFDGISVVIRRSIVRIMSPPALRGRIAAVAWIFIGSSNEIGAFESGVAASLIGPVPAVWAGGLVTLLVVSIVARTAPKLRALQF
jgi:MFS family permease